ncbi:MAG: PRC-barrel domain-containing protein [Caldimonas sp.]
MNKNLPRRDIVCALAAFGATGLAFGQAASAPASSASAAPAGPVAGRMLLGITIAETELVATGYRASKLLHVDVYNDRNEKIGKVDDLIISTDGTLSIVVLNVGGFLGLAKHLVIVPVRQFNQFAPKAILPNASKDQLKALPKFEYTS